MVMHNGHFVGMVVTDVDGYLQYDTKQQMSNLKVRMRMLQIVNSREKVQNRL